MICLATFKTTSAALLFERACREAGISARIAPVPRRLSSSCGLACGFPCGSRGEAEAVARENAIEIGGIYETEGEGCVTSNSTTTGFSR